MSWYLHFPLEPKSKKRPMPISRGRFVKMVTNNETRKYQKDLGYYAHIQWQGKPLLSQPLRVQCIFYMSRPDKGKPGSKMEFPAIAPDTDNFCKSLFDSLNKIIWVDDRQIIEIHAQKIFCEKGESPRIDLIINEVESLDSYKKRLKSDWKKTRGKK